MSALDRFIALGISWRTAPVAVRETLAFRPDEIAPLLSELRNRGWVAEAMLVSTCNRVELYGVLPERQGSAEVVLDAILRNRVGKAEARQAMYVHQGRDAVAHLFRVAAALDSLVLGEAQILGQIKEGAELAQAELAMGPTLGRWLDRAYACAKRVRTETTIARGAANVSSVAVELAHHVFGDLQGKSVLVVGAGKMSRLAAKHLAAAGAARLVVTNRSLGKAEALAADIGGLARPWSELATELALADVVLSSTGAPEPILTMALMKGVAKQRRWRPLVIIDIAVPRDAVPAIAELDGVYLFDIDDLQRVVSSNLAERAKASEEAQRIVEHELGIFSQWATSQAVVPTIVALRGHVSRLAREEAERLIGQLARKELDAATRDELILRMAQTLANKLVHQPSAALKQAPAEVARQYAETLQTVFALDATPPADERSVTPDAPEPANA